MIESQSYRYLDLDDDGVIDAVETVVVDVNSEGDATTIEVLDGVEAEIDDDGIPRRGAVIDTQVRIPK